MQDVVPAGYSAIGAISDSGVASGNTINWTDLSIADGETETLTFTAVVEATGPYLNVAQVTDADQNDNDSTPNNDDGNQSEDDEDDAEVTPATIGAISGNVSQDTGANLENVELTLYEDTDGDGVLSVDEITAQTTPRTTLTNGDGN